MLCSFPVFFLFSFSLSKFAVALPESATPTPRSIRLHRRPQPSRNLVQWGQWAKAQREGLIAKYADGPHKRGTGTNLYVKQKQDVWLTLMSYFTASQTKTLTRGMQTIMYDFHLLTWLPVSLVPLPLGPLRSHIMSYLTRDRRESS